MCQDEAARASPLLDHRDRAANGCLYRLAAEILTAVFPPRGGWPGQDCPVESVLGMA
jgi:hypothetical protein